MPCILLSVSSIINLRAKRQMHRSLSSRGPGSGPPPPPPTPSSSCLHSSTQTPRSRRSRLGRNTEIVPELSNDVGTRSVYNGSHQRERQLWLKARAACIRNGDSSGCMDQFDGSTTEAVDASAEAITTETGSTTTTRTAAQPQSRSFTVGRNSKSAESGVGSDGGGGGDASSRIRAVTGGSRSILVDGGAREFPPRSSSSDASPNPKRSLPEGRGGGFANISLPAGARDKLKQHPHPHPHPGIERKHEGVEVQEEVQEEVQVEVEASAGKREMSRLLRESVSAGLPGQATVDRAERRTVAVKVDGAAAGGDPVELPLEERLGRLETGIVLWGNTYVPPIAPGEKQRLIERWTGIASAEGGSKGETAAATAAVRGESANQKKITREDKRRQGKRGRVGMTERLTRKSVRAR